MPAGARDAKDLVVEIRVIVDPDGTVRQATIVDQGRLRRPVLPRRGGKRAPRLFQPAMHAAASAAEKYEIWKDLVVDFSPKDIL